jgi:cyclomaltodextrin glucanotransferase
MKQIRNIYLDKKRDYSELKKIIDEPYNAVIFIENQDIPRILSLKHIDTSLYDEMLKLVFLVPGAPCIYYGTEQYLHNKSYKYNRISFGQVGADPWNRDCMNWDIKNYKNKKAYSIINILSELKNKNLALKKGKLKLIDTDDQILAFERTYKGQKILYVSSIKERLNKTQIKTSLKDGKYTDPISMKEYTVSQKRLNLELKQFSSVILVSSN